MLSEWRDLRITVAYRNCDKMIREGAPCRQIDTRRVRVRVSTSRDFSSRKETRIVRFPRETNDSRSSSTIDPLTSPAHARIPRDLGRAFNPVVIGFLPSGRASAPVVSRICSHARERHAIVPPPPPLSHYDFRRLQPEAGTSSGASDFSLARPFSSDEPDRSTRGRAIVRGTVQRSGKPRVRSLRRFARLRAIDKRAWSFGWLRRCGPGRCLAANRAAMRVEENASRLAGERPCAEGTFQKLPRRASRLYIGGRGADSSLTLRIVTRGTSSFVLHTNSYEASDSLNRYVGFSTLSLSLWSFCEREQETTFSSVVNPSFSRRSSTLQNRRKWRRHPRSVSILARLTPASASSSTARSRSSPTIREIAQRPAMWPSRKPSVSSGTPPRTRSPWTPTTPFSVSSRHFLFVRCTSVFSFIGYP